MSRKKKGIEKRFSKMQVEINPFKSLQENANAHFEKAKKSKSKLKGLEKAMRELKEKAEKAGEKKTQKTLEKKRKKEWFEKFHWFYTSQNNLLCISGRDAQSNEQLVKKHLENNDLYFHAEIQGASHCILKEGLQKAGEKDRKETAAFAGVFSKAWNAKMASIDVYSVKAEQVSKQAKSGETLSTGAFMIYGSREWFKKTPLEFAIGVKNDGTAISGPLEAVRKNSKAFARIEHGNETKAEIAKKLQKQFEAKTGIKAGIDELITMLPGEGKIKSTD